MSDTKLYNYTIFGEADPFLLARVVGYFARYSFMPDLFRSELTAKDGQPMLQINVQIRHAEADKIDNIIDRLQTIFGIITATAECLSLVETNNQVHYQPSPTKLSEIEGSCSLYAVQALTEVPASEVIRSFGITTSAATRWNTDFSISRAAEAIRTITGQPWILDSGACQYSPPGQPMVLKDFLTLSSSDVLNRCLVSIETRLGSHAIAVINGEVVDNAYPGLVQPDDIVRLCVRPQGTAHREQQKREVA